MFIEHPIGTVLGAGNPTVNKTDKHGVFTLMGSRGGGDGHRQGIM